MINIDSHYSISCYEGVRVRTSDGASRNKYLEDPATDIKRRREDGLEGREGESLEAGARWRLHILISSRSETM